MARDIEIKGVRYSVQKMNDVFEQTFLMTRFAPVIAGATSGDIGEIFNKIGTMDKQTVKEIYFGLLDCVKRQNAQGSWSPIVNKASLSFMYDDIGMTDAIQLCKESMMENYGDFFPESGLNLKANAQK